MAIDDDDDVPAPSVTAVAKQAVTKHPANLPPAKPASKPASKPTSAKPTPAKPAPAKPTPAKSAEPIPAKPASKPAEPTPAQPASKLARAEVAHKPAPSRAQDAPAKQAAPALKGDAVRVQLIKPIQIPSVARPAEVDPPASAPYVAPPQYLHSGMPPHLVLGGEPLKVADLAKVSQVNTSVPFQVAVPVRAAVAEPVRRVKVVGSSGSGGSVARAQTLGANEPSLKFEPLRIKTDQGGLVVAQPIDNEVKLQVLTPTKAAHKQQAAAPQVTAKSVEEIFGQLTNGTAKMDLGNMPTLGNTETMTTTKTVVGPSGKKVTTTTTTTSSTIKKATVRKL